MASIPLYHFLNFTFDSSKIVAVLYSDKLKRNADNFNTVN